MFFEYLVDILDMGQPLVAGLIVDPALVYLMLQVLCDFVAVVVGWSL